MRYKITKEQLQEAVNKSLSTAQVCRELNLRPLGGNYRTLKKKFIEFGISTEHFTGQGWNVGVRYKNFAKTYSPQELFIKDSKCTSNKTVKRNLLDGGHVKYECNKCGISNWNGSNITLELNHIDGENTNNLISNLELLCPNCHSQTPTFRGKNQTSFVSKLRLEKYNNRDTTEVLVNKKIVLPKVAKTVVLKHCKVCDNILTRTRNVYCSYECKNIAASIKVPTYETLLEAFKIHKNFLQVGKHFNVSDNAVRKWCIRYGILDQVKQQGPVS